MYPIFRIIFNKFYNISAPGNQLSAVSTIFILCLFISLFLTGCGEQTCAYCGEQKICKEYDILGTTRLICDDCLNNPAANILSGSVIQEYADQPISASDNITLVTDYFSTPVTNNASSNQSGDTTADNSANMENGELSSNDANSDLTNPNDENAQPSISDNDQDMTFSDSSSSGSSDQDNTNMAEDNAQQSNSNETDGNNDNQASSSPATYNSVISALNNTYVSSGLQLVPEKNDNSVFGIYDGGNALGIQYNFTSTSSNAPALSVQKLSDASSSDYATACINAALAFLNSDDYNGIGYEVYNNAVDHGNYTYNGHHFYYSDLSANPNDGVTASFDIN